MNSFWTENPLGDTEVRRFSNALGLREGRNSVLIWPSGQVYIGSTDVHGVPEGPGIGLFPFGGVALGDFKEGLLEGKGVLKTPQGLSFACDFEGGFLASISALPSPLDPQLPHQLLGEAFQKKIGVVFSLGSKFLAHLTPAFLYLGYFCPTKNVGVGIKITAERVMETGEFGLDYQLTTGRRFQNDGVVAMVECGAVVLVSDAHCPPSSPSSLSRKEPSLDAIRAEKSKLMLKLDRFSLLKPTSVAETALEEDFLRFSRPEDDPIIEKFGSICGQFDYLSHGLTFEAAVASHFAPLNFPEPFSDFGSPIKNRLSTFSRLKDSSAKISAQQECRPSLKFSRAQMAQSIDCAAVEKPRGSQASCDSRQAANDAFYHRKTVKMGPEDHPQYYSRKQLLETRKTAKNGQKSLPLNRTEMDLAKTRENNRAHLPKSAAALKLQNFPQRVEIADIELDRLITGSTNSELMGGYPATPGQRLSMPPPTIPTSERKLGAPSKFQASINFLKEKLPTESFPSPLAASTSKKDLSIQNFQIAVNLKSEEDEAGGDSGRHHMVMSLLGPGPVEGSSERSEKGCEFMTFYKVGKKPGR